MKIKPEHYKQLLDAIQKTREDFPHVTMTVYREKGRSDERYRWDVLWQAARSGHIDITPWYSYLNDQHIGTALRDILGGERRTANVSPPTPVNTPIVSKI